MNTPEFDPTSKKYPEHPTSIEEVESSGVYEDIIGKNDVNHDDIERFNVARERMSYDHRSNLELVTNKESDNAELAEARNRHPSAGFGPQSESGNTGSSDRPRLKLVKSDTNGHTNIDNTDKNESSRITPELRKMIAETRRKLRGEDKK